MSKVLSLGSFDILHRGHIALFQACREIAGPPPQGIVVIAVDSDDYIMRHKQHAPVMGQDERMALVTATRYVDTVVLNKGVAQDTLIKTVRPDIIVAGKDWASRDYLAQLSITEEWLTAQGITVAYVQHEFSHSVTSSLLRERLEDST